MSFFKKLKERMFRSSDKIGEGLDALVADTAPQPDEVQAHGPETSLDVAIDPTPEADPAPAAMPQIWRCW